MTVEMLDLPRMTASSGQPRRVGVEIELGGISEEAAARVLKEDLGGTIKAAPERGWLVKESDIGTVQVYLDSRPLTKLDSSLGDKLQDLARFVVPIEIVTDPLLPQDIARLDRLLRILHAHGATGTSAGVLLGFGLHLNPQVPGETLEDVLPILTAFALMEDMLRADMKIDLSRRILPFVDPYPRSLIDALVKTPPSGMSALIDLYLLHAPSRNHGLDMLPLFMHLDADRVTAKMDTGAMSGRPTFHYRLPDCHVDDADWSVTLEWNRWARIERVAARADVLKRLGEAWVDHRAAFTTMRGDWAPRAVEILKAEGL